MIVTTKAPPSEKSMEILKFLRAAVTEALEKKRKLGQYAVIWDGKKPVKIRGDMPDQENKQPR